MRRWTCLLLGALAVILVLSGMYWQGWLEGSPVRVGMTAGEAAAAEAAYMKRGYQPAGPFNYKNGSEWTGYRCDEWAISVDRSYPEGRGTGVYFHSWYAPPVWVERMLGGHGY
jgi:hypothetical protein